MNSGQRTLVILAAIFAVLVVVTVVQVGGQTNIPAPQSMDLPFARVFPTLTDLALQAIRLETPQGQALTLARDSSGAWMAQEGSTLDPTMANNVALTLALLPYQRALPNAATAQDLRAYGFDPSGTLLIQFVTVTGEQHGVIIGGVVPTGEAYYAIVDDLPDLYLLERRAVDYLLVTLAG
jgi:hypothetical protein